MKDRTMPKPITSAAEVLQPAIEAQISALEAKAAETLWTGTPLLKGLIEMVRHVLSTRLSEPEQGGGISVAELVAPWADHHGDLPDYDHPVACVFDSGVQYAVELLAKVLKVEDWEVCDGTEEYDGDLGGTLFNIVLAAMPKDQHGDALHPSEVREALATPQPPTASVVEREAVADEGSIADAARMIASWCDGPARVNVYKAAKQQIAALTARAEPDADEVRLLDALKKITPIRVHDGPDYAEVYFADGSTHSTQAMTMNPQDWRDIGEALSHALPIEADAKGERA